MTIMSKVSNYNHHWWWCSTLTAVVVLIMASLASDFTVLGDTTATILSGSHCDAGNNICISAIRDVAGGVLTVTVQSKVAGYAAVGIGSTQMGGASMYIGYKDGKGGVTISQRSSQGHNTPQISATQEFTAVTTLPATVQPLPGAQITFSFNRTVAGSTASNTISTTGNTAFCFAYSSKAPSNPASNAATIVQHDNMDGFTLNLATSSASTTSSSGTTQPTASPGTNSKVSISSYCSGTQFCVTAMRDIPNDIVSYTLQSTIQGWVAMGVGSTSMFGATMYIAYKSSKGSSVTLSQRLSSGHNAPSMSPTQDFTVQPSQTLPSYVTPLAKANIVITFNRTLAGTSNANGISTSGATNYIFGYSKSTPSSPNSASSNIDQHDNYGVFSMDLSKPGVTIGTTASGLLEFLKGAHGVCMFLAWGVFPFVGIFTARYLKDKLGHRWYQIHVGTMLGGVGVFTALGLTAIEFSLPDDSPRFTTQPVHRLIGSLLSFGILPAQVALGYLANFLWKPTRTHVPWWDQVHWWFGRLACVLAIVEMFLGIDFYGLGVGWKVVYWVYIVAMLGGMVFGQFKFGVVHHVNGKTGGNSSSSLTGTTNSSIPLQTRSESNQRMLGDAESS